MTGEPCILEVALNGMTTPKELNPNVPRTPLEVTADALRCVEAGAAIVHDHTDGSLPPTRTSPGHADQPRARRAVALISESGRRVATPAETRAILGITDG